MYIIWDDNPERLTNLDKIAAHDLEQEEVESVLRDPTSQRVRSRSSGRPAMIGWTNTGRHIIVIYVVESDDPIAIFPVTASDVPERGDERWIPDDD